MNIPSSLNLIGLGVVVIAAITMLLYAIQKKGGKSSKLREIPAILRYKKAVNSAIESGKHVHVSLGNASILGPNNASALIGLRTRGHAVRLGAGSDRPPIATSGDGSLSILSRGATRAGLRSANLAGLYNPSSAYLSGITPYAYLASTLSVTSSKHVQTNCFIGNAGPEIAYLGNAAYKNSAFMLAGSESLPAQAVLQATAEEPLIGDEFFGIPAYLGSRPIDIASLKSQDFLRWAIIVFILVSILVKLVSN